MRLGGAAAPAIGSGGRVSASTASSSMASSNVSGFDTDSRFKRALKDGASADEVEDSLRAVDDGVEDEDEDDDNDDDRSANAGDATGVVAACACDVMPVIAFDMNLAARVKIDGDSCFFVGGPATVPVVARPLLPPPPRELRSTEAGLVREERLDEIDADADGERVADRDADEDEDEAAVEAIRFDPGRTRTAATPPVGGATEVASIVDEDEVEAFIRRGDLLDR